jgi:hypothetical protein
MPDEDIDQGKGAEQGRPVDALGIRIDDRAEDAASMDPHDLSAV